jgi:hypothetical protein
MMVLFSEIYCLPKYGDCYRFAGALYGVSTVANFYCQTIGVEVQ